MQLVHNKMVWVFKEETWSILLGRQWLQSLMSYSKENCDLSALTEIISIGPGQKKQRLQTWTEGREGAGCQNAVEKIIMMFKTSTVTFFCKITFFPGVSSGSLFWQQKNAGVDSVEPRSSAGYNLESECQSTLLTSCSAEFYFYLE